jgi:hypothetical protein
MEWWQWLFFCLGVATAFSLVVVLVGVVVRRIFIIIIGQSDAAPRQPEPPDTDLMASTEAPIRSVISTEARVG